MNTYGFSKLVAILWALLLLSMSSAIAQNGALPGVSQSALVARTGAFPIVATLASAKGPVEVAPQSTVTAASVNQCFQTYNTASPEERRFAEDVRSAIQNSATGKQVLQRVLLDCETRGHIDIEAGSFKNSLLFDYGETETIVGQRGKLDDAHKPRVFYYNRLFLNFKNDAAAISFASAVLAQELSRSVFRRIVNEVLPDYKDVIDFSFLEEQYSRVNGYLVACELSTEATGATIEAVDFSRNQQPFLDRLRLRYRYALLLDQSELLDPLSSYQERLQSLNAYSKVLKDQNRNLPILLDELDHALHSHTRQLGTLEPIIFLQDQTLAELHALPAEVEDVKLAIKNVTEMLSLLQTPTGDLVRQKLRDLSYDPAYAGMTAVYSEDAKQLDEFIKTKKLRDSSAEHSPMNRDQFREIFDKLHLGAPNPPWNDLEQEAAPTL
jgi:hypothetical protein